MTNQDRKQLITRQSVFIISRRDELNHLNAQQIRLKLENERLRSENSQLYGELAQAKTQPFFNTFRN